MLEKIIEIISKQLRTDAGEITAETSIMEDLGADSLDIVELLMAIEDDFDIKVPDEDVPNLKTVGDIASYVESHKA